MEDSDIVDLYFSRSERAIQETGSKYHAYLAQIAFNILRSRLDTEEIVNDTYFAAWNSIPPARPNILKYYLSRITRNLSLTRLDYLLAGKRHALEVELDECVQYGQARGENMCEDRELAAILNSFLGSLDRRSCAIFLARYYYGYQISEIAEKYDLSERQAKYSLSKSRAALRTTLEKEGV